jgi:hypothetical protein
MTPDNKSSRPPSAFRQRDVTRAIRAAAAAGVDIARVEVTKAGTIVIVTTAAAAVPTQEGSDDNPWNQAMTELQRRPT